MKRVSNTEEMSNAEARTISNCKALTTGKRKIFNHFKNSRFLESKVTSYHD